MAENNGNLTTLRIAEEETLGVLPTSRVWREREPNSYGDFGGNFSMTRRKPITHDRQHKRGEVSDSTPGLGYSEDLTPNNMQFLMQGFLAADAREPAQTAPLNGTSVTISGASGSEFTASAGLGIFSAGDLVLGVGFSEEENNIVHEVSAATSTALTLTSPVTAETPPSTASLVLVGHALDSGEASLSVTAASVILSFSSVDPTTFNFTAGEWICVGGDSAITAFSETGANAPFYGRIKQVTSSSIVFDKTSGTQATDAGTGKTIHLYRGTVIKNEDDCSLIKMRSYTAERVYGCGVNAEAEYTAGCVANQLTLNVPQPAEDAKVTCDFTFTAASSYERTAAEGLVSAEANTVLIDALNEGAFKPGVNVYANKLALIDESTLNPSPLVAYSSDCSVVINNNLSANKAIETFGHSSMTFGEFVVSGTINAYWTDVAATRAVRKNSAATWHTILTRLNTAVIFDMPEIGLGNGRAEVAANAAMKIPLEPSAGKSSFGHTLLVVFMPYVPAALVAN
jgi:hypothetical protein